MPVYRSFRSAVSFFDMLTGYLNQIANEANATLHLLSPRAESEPSYALHPTMTHRDDLLVRDGHPLLAVLIEYRAPMALFDARDYVEAKSYAGAQEQDKNLADMVVGLGKRLRDELTPTTRDEKPPAVELQEAQWTITLRGPDLKTTIWKGSPFDVAELDKAFHAIVDAIVARSKQVAAKA